MSKTFLAAYILVVVLAAAMLVRVQHVPAHRDVPAASIDELRKRYARGDVVQMRQLCRILWRTQSKTDDAPDDRVCEVIRKMHGVVGDDPDWFKRKNP